MNKDQLIKENETLKKKFIIKENAMCEVLHDIRELENIMKYEDEKYKNRIKQYKDEIKILKLEKKVLKQEVQQNEDAHSIAYLEKRLANSEVSPTSRFVSTALGAFVGACFYVLLIMWLPVLRDIFTYLIN